MNQPFQSTSIYPTNMMSSRFSFSQLLLILSFVFLHSCVQPLPVDHHPLQEIAERKEEDWEPHIGPDQFSQTANSSLQATNTDVHKAWEIIHQWINENSPFHLKITEEHLREYLYRLLYQVERVSTQGPYAKFRQTPTDRASQTDLGSRVDMMLLCASLSIMSPLCSQKGFIPPLQWEPQNLLLEWEFDKHLLELLQTSPLFPHRILTHELRDALDLLAMTFSCEKGPQHREYNPQYYGDHSLHHHHLVTHRNDEPHSCFDLACGKSFATVQHRNIHEDTAHPDDTLKCDVEKCKRPYGFAHQQSLDRHLAMHRKDMPSRCFYCNKSFPSMRARNVHQDRVHPDTNIECPHKGCKRICGFSDQDSLDRHLAMHPKDMPAGCSYCNKSFPNMRARNWHQDTVHPDTNIECPHKGCKRICGFSDQDSLDRHLAKYLKDMLAESDGPANPGSPDRHQSQVYRARKTHKCFKCDRLFSTQSTCNYHQDTFHPDDELKCDRENCKRRYGFATPGSLQRHLLHHSKQGEDNVNQKSVYSEKRLNSDREGSKSDGPANPGLPDRHQNQAYRARKTHKCFKCDRLFSTQSTCNVHQDTFHPDDELKCDRENCKRRYGFATPGSLQRHLLHHSKQGEDNVNQKSVYSEKRLKSHHEGSESDGSANPGLPDRHQNQAYRARKTHKCFKCDRLFSTQRTCNYHQDTFHPDDELKCDRENCKRRYGYATPGSLQRHLLRHSKQGEDNINQKSVYSKKRLNSDREGSESDGPANLGSPDRHQSQAYRARKTHKCFKCDRLFSTQSTCNYHQDTFHPDDELKCDRENCKRRYGFATPGSLQRHLLHHSKQGEDNVNQKSVYSEKRLKSHHEGSESDGSANPGLPDRHQNQAYRARKTHKCFKCDRLFSTQSTCNVHQDTFHPDDKLKCDRENCKRRGFATPRSLRRHLLNHGRGHQSSINRESFIFISEYDTHQDSVHPAQRLMANQDGSQNYTDQGSHEHWMYLIGQNQSFEPDLTPSGHAISSESLPKRPQEVPLEDDPQIVPREEILQEVKRSSRQGLSIKDLLCN